MISVQLLNIINEWTRWLQVWIVFWTESTLRDQGKPEQTLAMEESSHLNLTLEFIREYLCVQHISLDGACLTIPKVKQNCNIFVNIYWSALPNIPSPSTYGLKRSASKCSVKTNFVKKMDFKKPFYLSELIREKLKIYLYCVYDW